MTRSGAISESSKLSINPQRQLTPRDHRTMEPHQPVGEVFYLPDGSFYVQACPPDVNFCPQVRVSPGLDAAVQQHRNASSAALMEAVDAIDSDDEDEEVEVPATSTQRDGGSLLEAVDAIDSDDDDEPVVVQTNASLLDTVSAMDSDDEEEALLDEQLNPNIVMQPTRMAISGAALDLCSTVDLSQVESQMSDSDSSSSESEDGESESEEESDEELVGKHTMSTPRPSSWESDYLSVDQVDRVIRSNMAEIEAKKPWRFVFRCLLVPFNFKRQDDPFDVFFMRWDEFWHVHGRAVWERGFWQPLLVDSTEYHRRKWRQTRAQRAFCELATDLMERLGDRYRRGLSKTLHEGWWYRAEPFPLRRLFLKNRSLYEEYLERRVKQRWPRGRKFLLERGLKPMWWLPESTTSDSL